MNRHFLIGLSIAAVLAAYPLMAAWLHMMNLSGAGQLPSVVLRLAVCAVALLAVVANIRSLRLYQPHLIIAVLVFWLMYTYRVFHEGFIEQTDIRYSRFSGEQLLAMVFLFVMIPMLPAFVGLTQKSSRLGFNALFLMSALTALMLFLDVGNLKAMAYEGVSRFSTEKLNPITVGYVGGTLLLLSVVGLLRNARHSTGSLPRFVLIAGVPLGLLTLLLAASRGPVLATAVALMFFCLFPVRVNRLAAGAALVAVVIVAGSVLYGNVVERFGFDVVARITGEAEATGSNLGSREAIFAAAWKDFSNSPWLGEALVPKDVYSYPHNALLDALLATGVGGGAAYLFCVFLLVFAAARLLRREDGAEWLAVIAIFYLVAFQFSGSHFSAAQHWVTLVAVVVTEIKFRPAPPARTERSVRLESVHAG